MEMCIDTKRELLCNFFILVCSGCPWLSKAFEVAERSEAGAHESLLINTSISSNTHQKIEEGMSNLHTLSSRSPTHLLIV